MAGRPCAELETFERLIYGLTKNVIEEFNLPFARTSHTWLLIRSWSRREWSEFCAHFVPALRLRTSPHGTAGVDFLRKEL